MLTTALPPRSDQQLVDEMGYTNTRDYSARGYPYFERVLSSLVKDPTCLWDFAHYAQVCHMPSLPPSMPPLRICSGPLPPSRPPLLTSSGPLPCSALAAKIGIPKVREAIYST